jgi:hypothetical protein
MSGLSLFLVFVILYFAGFNPIGGISWVGAWIPLVFIVIATKYIRDQILGGYISYGAAFRTGLLAVFFSSLLYALLIYVFGRLIDDSIVVMYQEEIRKSAEEAQALLSEKMIDQVLEEAENVTMSSIALNDFTGKMTGGIIVSLITAAFLMRKKPVEFNQD